jgi:hypothetical protein
MSHTTDTTKKALAAAHKAYAASPSATNWQRLIKAMEEHQEAFTGAQPNQFNFYSIITPR